MADEDAELIGGISVSVGASHAKLVSDLAEADRILEAWSKQRYAVSVGANVTTPTGGTPGGGGSSALEAKLDRLASALSAGTARDIRQARADASAVSIKSGTGKASGFGSIEDLMNLKGPQAASIKAQLEKAIGPVEVPVAVGSEQIEQAEMQVHDLQVTTNKPIHLLMDTKELQLQLDAILASLKAIVAEAGNVSKTKIAGGGGGGRRPPAAAAAAPAEDEGPELNEFGSEAIQYGPNRRAVTSYQAREAAGFGGGRINIARPIRVVVSPQQRAAERQAREASAEQRRVEREAATAQQEQAALFDDMVDNTGINLGSATIAPQHTEASRARAAADQERRRAATAARGPQSEAERAARSARDQAAADRFNAAGAGEGLGGGAGGGGGGRGTAVRRTAEDVERTREEAVARRESEVVSAGRTARTQASGYLGGFLGAGGRERIKAQADLAAANERVRISQRNLNEAESAGDPVARRHAVEELTVAENDRATALKKVESFTGIGAGVKNLLAVTAAGAAFGLGLEGVSIAAKAAEKALAPYFDVGSGYAQKTADLTAALADQARQQQGNAQGVTALKLAQTGFAASTAASIQPIISQRVQIEAGNKALVEQVETFRIAENLRKQGVGTGIGGSGTGGVLGTSLFGIPSTGEQAGNFLQGLGQDTATRTSILNRPKAPLEDQSLGVNNFLEGLFGLPKTTITQRQKDEKTLAEAQATEARGIAFLNDQLVQGGNAAAQFTQSLDKTDPRIERTAQAFDGFSPEMAKAVRDLHLFSNGIKDTNEGVSALTALNLAGTLTGPAEQLAQQQVAAKNAANSVQAIMAEQARQLPGFLAGIERQQQVAIGTQLPAQAALANLAAPPTPVGTGIVGRNAAEQAKINQNTKETQQLQDTLNSYYAKGYDILKTTYEIPAPLLAGIQQVGQEIAATQAGIANEQSQYQVAQFNYQLKIARRTLSDIGGLTGQNFGAGQSYLGVLEKQNLALSRQGQMLQFALSQRQINFQTAVAGFQVPGLTPAEQNARVEEAKVEASYAQKQLNIQREMFHNQVQIVDIGNLRQGRDLANQIGLLLQGRKVTIDTAIAQEKLQRLQATQEKLVAEAGTYITKVNARIAQAEANMGQIEAATGKAITVTMERGITAAFAVGNAFFQGITGGFLGSGGGGASSSPGGGPKSQAHRPLNAAGALFNTQGTTSLGPYGVAGEAGRETVAILRNPHQLAGLGGGGQATVNFNGDMIFKTEADFQRLYRMVLAALGNQASIKGLRTPF